MRSLYFCLVTSIFFFLFFMLQKTDEKHLIFSLVSVRTLTRFENYASLTVDGFCRCLEIDDAQSPSITVEDFDRQTTHTFRRILHQRAHIC